MSVYIECSQPHDKHSNIRCRVLGYSSFYKTKKTSSHDDDDVQTGCLRIAFACYASMIDV